MRQLNFNSKLKQMLHIIRENNTIPVVIEYHNKKLKHYAGETIRVYGRSDLISALEKINSNPDNIISKVYLLLLEEKEINNIFEKDE